MKLNLDLLTDLLEEVYPTKELAKEIERRIELQIAEEVANEVTVFNVWLHKHGVLGRLQRGELDLVPHNSSPRPLHYRGPQD